MQVIAPDERKMRQLTKRGVAEIIVEEEMVKLLHESAKSQRPLRLKQGFDPSAPDIHLGHVVGLRKLRQFQELGHQVILIVGDWTAQIGDPSGVSVTRPMLSPEQVRANAETYMKQFFKVVNREKTQVVWQSEWFGKFTLKDVIALTSKFTVAQMLQRDDFAKRYAAGRPIAITEFLYPLLQAYDSVVIEADVEFGGTDQKFNCLVGRELQGIVGQPRQQVFLVPLLVGTDGTQKMSKSLGNYIGIDEPPHDMYGKVMSIPDNLILDYFELLTDVSDEELAQFREQLATESVNPMHLKKHLAREIVVQFHGVAAAREAEAEFEKVVQRKEAPEETAEVRVSFDHLLFEQPPHEIEAAQRMGFAALLWKGDAFGDEQVKELLISIPFLLHKANLVDSKSEARRLVSQGAIEVDGKRVVADVRPIVKDGSIIRVGKRRWVKVIDADLH